VDTLNFTDYLNLPLLVLDDNVSLYGSRPFFTSAANSKGVFNLDTFGLIAVVLYEIKQYQTPSQFFIGWSARYLFFALYLLAVVSQSIAVYVNSNKFLLAIKMQDGVIKAKAFFIGKLRFAHRILDSFNTIA
jgi:hypothetical protein